MEHTTYRLQYNSSIAEKTQVQIGDYLVKKVASHLLNGGWYQVIFRNSKDVLLETNCLHPLSLQRFIAVRTAKLLATTKPFIL